MSSQYVMDECFMVVLGKLFLVVLNFLFFVVCVFVENSSGRFDFGIFWVVKW